MKTLLAVLGTVLFAATPALAHPATAPHVHTEGPAWTVVIMASLLVAGAGKLALIRKEANK